MTDHILQLPGNRNLSYAIYGPGDGQPVFYFHGTPSSRLELMMLPFFGVEIEELLRQYHIKIIAADRPGFGNSHYNPRGTFGSFANDLSFLAKALKITRASSLAWSGGGPYALSQAYHFPGTIERVHILTGFTISFNEIDVLKNMASNRYYFRAAKYMPWVLKQVLQIAGKKPSKKPIPQWISQLPDVDHNLLGSEAGKTEAFTRYTEVEAVRNGAEGPVHEARLYFNTSDYSLKDIQQPVHYWWGTMDNVVIAHHYKALQAKTPNAILHMKKGEGHFSIYVNYMEEVLRTISNNDNQT
jgi:pimeloyl-ACP methyl ester carboxylesterase